MVLELSAAQSGNLCIDDTKSRLQHLASLMFLRRLGSCEAKLKLIISIIQQTVQRDAAEGRVVDVDTYCARFTTMRPDLDPSDIRELVQDAVASFGSGGFPGEDRHTQH